MQIYVHNSMRSFLLACLLALSAFNGYGQNAELKITVHPGVELLSIVQKLAGRLPDTTPTSYEREMLACFTPYRQHPAVQQLQQFNGQVYPDLTELGFCFGDSPDVPLGSLPDSSHWYRSYGKAVVQDYLRKCQDFATASNFRQFYQAHAAAYAAWGAPIRAGIARDSLLGKLHGFYRTAEAPHFYICLDPLNGWGAHAIPHPEEMNPTYRGIKAYTIGCFAVAPDSSRTPVFKYGDYTTNLVWHEGGHIYVQELFGRYAPQIAALSYLYNGQDSGMKSQNINSWQYCLNENVVRGVVLTLFKQYKSDRAWRRQGAQEVLADFIYASDISDILLRDYVGHSKKYPDFAAFFPVLLRRLQQRHPAPPSPGKVN